MRRFRSLRRLLPIFVAVALPLTLHACVGTGAADRPSELLLVDGRIYTLSWDEPALDGTPAEGAPLDAKGWHPDANALLIRNGAIAYVGDEATARSLASPTARVLDADGATVLPGLIESHAHVAELGHNLGTVSLVGAKDEREAVDRVARRAAEVPAGRWIFGHGWDEGAWADRYPTRELLSTRVPDHPCVLVGLHGFAVWGNDAALAAVGITAETKDPDGGKILRDERGVPTGVLLNRATPLLVEGAPQPSLERRMTEFERGLRTLARSGYVAVHEAGVDGPTLEALEALDRAGRLPLRVYAMLSARDRDVCESALAVGPRPEADGMLTVRAVKAYYDGALGSRGAKMLDDYTDRPGHRGVAGAEYQFDRELVTAMMRAGFQVAIHAIGDAGNRETLDFVEQVLAGAPPDIDARHRVEHAQVVHADDFPRFAELGLIASMEPAHAMEDKAWAQIRLGPDRIRGAYAWRTMRLAGVPLAFNSDLPGSDHSITYGLHAAITRRDKRLQPPGGWFPEQRMTPEEAVRGYTTGGAYASFAERSGQLREGFHGDLTLLDFDPLELGRTDPTRILRGKVLATIVGGEIVFRREE